MIKSAGVVIIYKNKILLVHPTGSKRYYYNYSFPKGQVEEGEEIIDCALRELKEEVGISLNKNQLDKKMHTIPYIANKNKKGVTKGSVYKTVYYWTCHIDDLSEIGLKSEVVPKNQLQKSEVDWAGFVPADQVEKRIAPVMKSISKHVKINENMLLESYNEYITEKRSENSKIAKRAKTNKETVDIIRKELDEIDPEVIVHYISNKTNIDNATINKVLNTMKRLLGGDLRVNIKL